jgi:hypothetical protein
MYIKPCPAAESLQVSSPATYLRGRCDTAVAEWRAIHWLARRLRTREQRGHIAGPHAFLPAHPRHRLLAPSIEGLRCEAGLAGCFLVAHRSVTWHPLRRAATHSSIQRYDEVDVRDRRWWRNSCDRVPYAARPHLMPPTLVQVSLVHYQPTAMVAHQSKS